VIESTEAIGWSVDVTAARYDRGELANDLERIRELEGDLRVGLDVLYAEARSIQSRIDGMRDVFESFHFVMHYLIDIDLRRRDSVYAEGQYRDLDRVLLELRRS
jgi:hypothetical protein